MSLFAKAAEKTASAKTAARPKKNTTWVVGDPEGDVVADAVHQIVELSAKSKANDARMKIAKTVVLKYAKENHISDFCSLGVPPDTPMSVQNTDGEKVSLVVQDRSGQYAVKDEQREALVCLLGADGAEDLLYTETSIGFDRTVLGIPGVSEAIEGALEKAISSLVKKEVLTGDQADELIVAGQKTSFKPGTMDRAASIVGRDTNRLTQLLDIFGSSCCRFVKA